MKEYVMQYLAPDGSIHIAYVRAHSKEEAGEKLRKKLKEESK